MKWKKLTWLLPLIAVIIALFLWFDPLTNERQKAITSKANLIKTEVFSDESVKSLGDGPVDSVGHVVFFSVCNGTTRAKVYTGTGKTLSDAWKNALNSTLKEVKADSTETQWLRVDVVSNARPTTAGSVLKHIDNVYSGFNFNGLAFDPEFKTAILEGELNGRHIYDYKENTISITLLNDWLKEHGKEKIQELPENLIEFKCYGWFCDENNDIYSLCNEGADNSRRQISTLDADYAKNVIDTALTFLVEQVKEDGSFIYGMYPQYDEEIDNYNILRHSGTIWALICRYRMFPEDKLKETIARTINYMLSQIKYDEDGAAYLHEAKDFEYKLGGNGIAVVALTEYMDVFQNEEFRDVCVSLGEGILKLQNPETGEYWHILNNDFSRGEDFRTVYYDGECTFALARLYSLTGDQKWLDAACKAIDHFIDEDYTRYRDHWVAYSLNEVTKYIERQEYYDFALANATNNYAKILGRERTFPTNLELLISAFETWQRMVDKGMDTGDFNVQDLLDAIAARANRQLSGYFYPELAMYMENPQRILGSFMMRNDKFRVRIDDVQHNIGGFYLYWKNYDAMIAAGLDPSRTDISIINSDQGQEESTSDNSSLPTMPNLQ